MTTPHHSEPARGTPTGWPDPLESPQAQAIRAGLLDDTAIRDLFDQMERELRLHRARGTEPAREAVAHPTSFRWTEDLHTALEAVHVPVRKVRMAELLLLWRGLMSAAQFSASPAPSASGRITYEPCDRDAGEIIVNGQSMRRVRPELTASGGLEAARVAKLISDGYRETDETTARKIIALLSASPAPAASGGLEAVREDVKEFVAKVVYAAMKWAAERAENGKPPEWVERGNSLAQTEARRVSRNITDYIRAALAAPAATGGEAVAPIGYMRAKDNDGNSFWCSRRRGSYYTVPVYTHPASSETGASVGVKEHPDDIAVNRFAVAMKAKLAKKRAEGRGGWEDKADCSQAFLSCLLREHVEKGDPVDVANFCMMLHQRGERIG